MQQVEKQEAAFCRVQIAQGHLKNAPRRKENNIRCTEQGPAVKEESGDPAWKQRAMHAARPQLETRPIAAPAPLSRCPHGVRSAPAQRCQPPRGPCTSKPGSSRAKNCFKGISGSRHQPSIAPAPLLPSPWAPCDPSHWGWEDFTRQSLGELLGDEELNQQDLPLSELLVHSQISQAPMGAAVGPVA